MPKIARLDTPGLLHHIMIRGIKRGKIFDYDKDREDSAEWLNILFRVGDLLCY
jgi:putative transposase